jgi:hypothetical protein
MHQNVKNDRFSPNNPSLTSSKRNVQSYIMVLGIISAVTGSVGAPLSMVAVPTSAVATSTSVVGVAQSAVSQQSGQQNNSDAAASSSKEPEEDLANDPRLAKFTLIAQCSSDQNHSSRRDQVDGKQVVLRCGKVCIVLSCPLLLISTANYASALTTALSRRTRPSKQALPRRPPLLRILPRLPIRVQTLTIRARQHHQHRPARVELDICRQSYVRAQIWEQDTESSAYLWSVGLDG